MVRPAVLALLVVMPSGCGLLGKRVSEDDCTKWDKHYREALEETSTKLVSKCKDSPAAKAYLKNIEETIANSADAMASGCRGAAKIASYSAEEEKCFLGTNDAKAWAKCEHKATSGLQMYLKSGEAWVKSAEGICKGAGGGDDESDDDDSKKKKKKKKKSDDDE